MPFSFNFFKKQRAEFKDKIHTVYHVGVHPGAQRPAHAHSISYEAHGFSVSMVPGAWCKIARCSGSWWRLTGPGRFLDALKLDQNALLATRPDLVRSTPYF